MNEPSTYQAHHPQTFSPIQPVYPQINPQTQSPAYLTQQSQPSYTYPTQVSQPSSIYPSQSFPAQSNFHSISTPNNDFLPPNSPNSLVSNLMKFGLLGMQLPEVPPLDLNNSNLKIKEVPSIAAKKFINLTSEDLQMYLTN